MLSLQTIAEAARDTTLGDVHIVHSSTNQKHQQPPLVYTVPHCRPVPSRTPIGRVSYVLGRTHRKIPRQAKQIIIINITLLISSLNAQVIA